MRQSRSAGRGRTVCRSYRHPPAPRPYRPKGAPSLRERLRLPRAARHRDKLTITAERIDGGKLRCTSATWSDPVVILEGEFLALKNIDRQVHAIRTALGVEKGPPGTYTGVRRRGGLSGKLLAIRQFLSMRQPSKPREISALGSESVARWRPKGGPRGGTSFAGVRNTAGPPTKPLRVHFCPFGWDKSRSPRPRLTERNLW
jgi:hypothetical protein